MAKDLNRWQGTGRLGKDPEAKYLASGTCRTSLSIACGRSYTKESGEKVDETEWVSLIAWNKLGEICAQYLKKGSRVYVEGRLQTRSWDDTTTGEKHYKTEIVLTDMIMLDSKKAESGNSGGDGEEAYDRPAPRPSTAYTPRKPAPATVGPDEDDSLPF